MNKITKLLALSFLIIALVATTGCIDQEQKTPIYPDSQEIDIPNKVSEKLDDEILPNSTLTAYKTQSEPEEVRQWYNDELSQNDWNQQFEKFNATVWRKGTSFLAITVFDQQKSNQLFEMNQTTFLVVDAT
ncbi:hypothetical protein C9439_08065 [archaeon SCG-AAA382B04]|nr:hypothetical protein C9439_08065 [archaeon SCG-AAA382B04]